MNKSLWFAITASLCAAWFAKEVLHSNRAAFEAFCFMMMYFSFWREMAMKNFD